MAEVLFWLVCGHMLADYSLQGDTMAKNKNRHSNAGLNGFPQWYYWLTAHAFIHGGFVGIVTHVWWLGALETAAHWVIDFLKCDRVIGIHTDQALHLFCKVLWALLVVWGFA